MEVEMDLQGQDVIMDRRTVDPSQERFESLCAIGRLLTGFEDVPTTVGAVLTEARRLLPIRSAVVVDVGEGEAQSFMWSDEDVPESRRSELVSHARERLEYLRRLGERVPELEFDELLTTPMTAPATGDRSDATDRSVARLVVLPLVARPFEVRGVVQFELVGAELAEGDVACAGAIVNHLAVALEAHHARARLASLAAQLEEVRKTRALATLVGGVAHHFNNQLMTILASNDLMRVELGASHPAVGMLDDMRQAGNRVVALTARLLAIGRRQRLAARTIDVNALITGMTPHLSELVEGSSRGLKLSLAPELPPVTIDPAQLEIVVAALVVNAHEASSTSEAIVISTCETKLESRKRRKPCATPGEYVAISVIDHGRGMDPSVQERMFEPFFSTKDPGLVAGLGLAVVDGIVAQSGGCISVLTEEGKGTTVTVLLPVKLAAADFRTVLVASSDAGVRTAIVPPLRAKQHVVVHAGDWDAAVKSCVEYQGRIDLVLLDVGTIPPSSDVAGAVYRLRLLRPHVPVVIVSSRAGPMKAPAGDAGSGVAVLPGPFTPEQLTEAMHAVMSPRETDATLPDGGRSRDTNPDALD